jgi:hypothetical protein
LGVIFMAAAATFRLVGSRHMMDAHPSGEITE